MSTFSLESTHEDMSDAIVSWKYNHLTSYLSLETCITSLISALRYTRLPWERVLERLEAMQMDFQRLGHHFRSYKALIHHRHLTLDLTSHVDSVRVNSISFDELIKCLELSARDVSGLDDYFKVWLPPIYWNVRRAADSTMAQKVFGIPEILENILTNCEVLDVLNFYQTCKGVRDIIDESSKMEMHMFLKSAAEGTSRRHPFDQYDLPGFSCSFELATTRPLSGRTIDNLVGSIELEMDPDGVCMSHIGERLQDMLICQPPIHRILFAADCPLDDNEMLGDPDYMQFESEDGVKIRDVYAMAERLMGIHNVCRDPIRYTYYRMEPRRVTVCIQFQECLYASDWTNALRSTIGAWGVIEEEEKKGGPRDETRSDVESNIYDYDHYDNPGAQRCKDYDTKGFCVAGASCSYEHGYYTQHYEKTPDCDYSASILDDYDSYDEGAHERGYYEADENSADAEMDDAESEDDEIAERELAAAVYEGYGDDVVME